MEDETPDSKKPLVPGSPEAKKAPGELTVVGVGASAGGLEALTELLQGLPPSSNMVFVVIQHLDPHHESILPDLLARQTGLRVMSVQQNVRMQANQVYVISPNTLLRVW